VQRSTVAVRANSQTRAAKIANYHDERDAIGKGSMWADDVCGRGFVMVLMFLALVIAGLQGPPIAAT
jgi:hypothetical protein